MKWSLLFNSQNFLSGLFVFLAPKDGIPLSSVTASWLGSNNDISTSISTSWSSTQICSLTLKPPFLILDSRTCGHPSWPSQTRFEPNGVPYFLHRMLAPLPWHHPPHQQSIPFELTCNTLSRHAHSDCQYPRWYLYGHCSQEFYDLIYCFGYGWLCSKLWYSGHAWEYVLP